MRWRGPATEKGQNQGKEDALPRSLRVCPAQRHLDVKVDSPDTACRKEEDDEERREEKEKEREKMWLKKASSLHRDR